MRCHGCRPARGITIDNHCNHLMQLHGKFCSRCTYDGRKIGVKESKCTGVSDVQKYALISGIVGEFQ